MSTHDHAQHWEFDDDIFNGGVHLCYIYNDDEERARTMAKFFAKGIQAGQKALCIVDTLQPHDIHSSLRRIGVDIDGREDIFSTSKNEESYCPGGVFDPDSLLAGVGGFCTQARNEGYSGARISGDMSWALRKNVEMSTLMEYETKVTEYLQTTPFTAICEYDARKFSGSAIMDILSVHPAMIVQGQVVRNPYFVAPQEYMRQHTRH